MAAFDAHVVELLCRLEELQKIFLTDLVVYLVILALRKAENIDRKLRGGLG